MNDDDGVAAVRDALRNLIRAREALAAPTVPIVPVPRSRVWRLSAAWQMTVTAKGLLEMRSPVGYSPQHLVAAVEMWNATRVGDEVLASCQGQPRRIAHVLVLLRAATVWCEARRAGRERAAAEVVRQQQKWADVVAAEAAMARIAK